MCLHCDGKVGLQGRLDDAAAADDYNNINNKQEFMYRDTANVEPEMYV
jgi:hypothetical protein